MPPFAVKCCNTFYPRHWLKRKKFKIPEKSQIENNVLYSKNRLQYIALEFFTVMLQLPKIKQDDQLSKTLK